MTTGLPTQVIAHDVQLADQASQIAELQDAVARLDKRVSSLESSALLATTPTETARDVNPDPRPARGKK